MGKGEVIKVFSYRKKSYLRKCSLFYYFTIMSDTYKMVSKSIFFYDFLSKQYLDHKLSNLLPLY